MADRADILPIISAGQSMTGGVLAGAGEIGRAHVRTPVTA